MKLLRLPSSSAPRWRFRCVAACNRLSALTSVAHTCARVAMQTARDVWAAVRPRSSVDALRSLPVWRLLEALPNQADADSDPSSSPAIPTVEGFPLCTEDGRVQISARHAGASRANASTLVHMSSSRFLLALAPQVLRGPQRLMQPRMQPLLLLLRSSFPRLARVRRWQRPNAMCLWPPMGCLCSATCPALIKAASWLPSAKCSTRSALLALVRPCCEHAVLRVCAYRHGFADAADVHAQRAPCWIAQR